MNITYLLGAGASYNVRPIQGELSEQMRMVFRILHGIHSRENPQIMEVESLIEMSNLPHEFVRLLKNDRKEAYKLAHLISHIGYQGQRFGTVDTYAKMLFLNKDFKAFNRVKYALSSFFTLYELNELRELYNNLEGRSKSLRVDIDRRYIQLMASLLSEGALGISLPENVNFITWNYDLQLEKAFSLFHQTPLSLRDVKDKLNDKNSSFSNRSKICHLNGHYGVHSGRNVDEVDFTSQIRRELEDVEPVRRQIKCNKS